MNKTANPDIMGLQQEIEKLKIENQLLNAIIDGVHESVYAVNEKDEVILYNSESERTEGLDRRDVIGKKEDDAFMAPYHFSDEVTKKILITGKPSIEQPYWYYLNDGRKTNMIYSAFPFYYQGKIIAVYVVFRNVNQISSFIATTLEMQKKFIREENDSTGNTYLLDDIIGVNKNIKKIVQDARRIARRKSPVMIVGETGTGKELFAQGIHNASLNSKGPFIPVNCAAIPDTLLESLIFGTVKGAFTGAHDLPGLFEQAEDGTIFLDEINSMSYPLQAKLLRVLQDKSVRRLGGKRETPVNCRIISATNMDPLEAVRKEIIRQDLYFRLATVTITIPPLRERKDDMEVLAMHFIHKYNREFGLFINRISPELLNLFHQYNWSGNVRELENIIESAMNFVHDDEKVLELGHIPEYFRDRLSSTQHILNIGLHQLNKKTLQSALLETERKLIENALSQNQGNITKTARQLGISRQNLHHKINILKID